MSSIECEVCGEHVDPTTDAICGYCETTVPGYTPRHRRRRRTIFAFIVTVVLTSVAILFVWILHPSQENTLADTHPGDCVNAFDYPTKLNAPRLATTYCAAPNARMLLVRIESQSQARVDCSVETDYQVNYGSKDYCYQVILKPGMCIPYVNGTAPTAGAYFAVPIACGESRPRSVTLTGTAASTPVYQIMIVTVVPRNYAGCPMGLEEWDFAKPQATVCTKSYA